MDVSRDDGAREEVHTNHRGELPESERALLVCLKHLKDFASEVSGSWMGAPRTALGMCSPTHSETRESKTAGRNLSEMDCVTEVMEDVHDLLSVAGGLVVGTRHDHDIVHKNHHANADLAKGASGGLEKLGGETASRG